MGIQGSRRRILGWRGIPLHRYPPRLSSLRARLHGGIRRRSRLRLRQERLRDKRDGQAARLRHGNRIQDCGPRGYFHKARGLRELRRSRILAIRRDRRGLPRTAAGRRLACGWRLSAHTAASRTGRRYLGTQRDTGAGHILAGRETSNHGPRHRGVLPRIQRCHGRA